MDPTPPPWVKLTAAGELDKVGSACRPPIPRSIEPRIRGWDSAIRPLESKAGQGQGGVVGSEVSGLAADINVEGVRGGSGGNGRGEAFRGLRP